MRFGRNLYQNRVVGWEQHYIDYYGLKKAIKFAIRSATEPQHSDIDLTAFDAALASEVSKVQAFYAERLRALLQRSVIEIHGDEALHTRSPHRRASAVAACLRYRVDICSLRWYGRVNADGVRYLARKLSGVSSAAAALLTTLTHDGDFVRQHSTLNALEAADNLLSTLNLPQPGAEPLSGKAGFSVQLPTAALNILLDNALHLDDGEEFDRLLREEVFPHSVLYEMLREAVHQGARQCAQVLLSKDSTILHAKDSMSRNIFHLLVISASLEVVLRQDIHGVEKYNSLLGSLASSNDDYVAFLAFLLDATPQIHQYALFQQDYRGRTPLHYAAEAGLSAMCETLTGFFVNWSSFGGHANSLLLKDCDGNTPMHLSVVNNHSETTQTLLTAVKSFQITENLISHTLSSYLAIAIHQKSTSMIKVLMSSGLVNTHYRSSCGETAVHVAARAGCVEYIRMLASASPRPNLDARDSAYEWTPLIIACVYNREAVVKVLVELGVDQNLTDAFGWRALDHVAFRGYWDISRLLDQSLPTSNFRIPKLPIPTTNALPILAPSTTRVFVNIGPLNTRKMHDAVDLTPLLSCFPFSSHPSIRYSIAIKGLGMTGHGVSTDLPVLDDRTNYPCVFETDNPKAAKVLIHLFQEKADMKEPDHIGTAVALLEELGNKLGSGRESLFRDYTLPIIGHNKLAFLGTITINFLLATSFPDPRRSPTPLIDKEVWNPNGKAKLIGHRGLGMNNPAFKRLQIGENTIQSFKSTIELGVSYVECDVQLTRDHVPVIYHDFLVSESGADIAPMNLSYDQFMCISDMQRPVPKDNNAFGAHVYSSPSSLRQRSQSFDGLEDFRIRDFLTRIKHTHEFKVKGFKGNIRGTHIHDSFITLEQLLRSLPEDVAFDIELKYPMLWEAEDWKMDLYGVEFNLYTDKVLEQIYNYSGNRSILFTSFSPELCILASHKQDTYPVMFLNESNLFPTGDVRASNLQEAIHFARHWGLPGIVMSSEPFVASPKLVRFVQDAGLMCTSFGMPNNDPENARVQALAGIDAIIVDSVALINHNFKRDIAQGVDDDTQPV